MYAPLLTLISGLLSSLQGAINNQLGKDLSLPLMILSVSLVQCCIALLWLIGGGTPLSLASVWQGRILLAGLLGVLIMAGIAWSISQRGAVLTYGLIIFGQLLFSLFIDLFGWLGVEAKTITGERMVSLGLMGVAVLLLIKDR